MSKEEITSALNQIILKAEMEAEDDALLWVLNNCHLSEEDYYKVKEHMNNPCYD